MISLFFVLHVLISVPNTAVRHRNPDSNDSHLRDWVPWAGRRPTRLHSWQFHLRKRCKYFRRLCQKLQDTLHSRTVYTFFDSYWNYKENAMSISQIDVSKVTYKPLPSTWRGRGCTSRCGRRTWDGIISYHNIVKLFNGHSVIVWLTRTVRSFLGTEVKISHIENVSILFEKLLYLFEI